MAWAQVAPQAIPADEMRMRSASYTPPTATAMLRAQSDLVLARVVMRDSKGRPVSGLQQNDFQLLDNGKPQTIGYFVVQTAQPTAPQKSGAPVPADAPPPEAAMPKPPPRYVALFFDDGNMPLRDLVPARKAAQDFVASGAKSGDRIGLFTSSGSVTLEFTDDYPKVLEKLAELRPHLRRADDGPGQCPRIGPHQAHLMVRMNDRQALDVAIAQAQQACPAFRRESPRYIAAIVQRQADYTLSMAEQLGQGTLERVREVAAYLARMPGPRTLLLASSGFWTTTLQSQQHKLIDQALRAGIVINALDAKGLAVGASTADPSEGPPIVLAMRPDLQSFADRLLNEQREVFNDPLAVISQGTGGRFFHNNNDLDRGMRELAGAPEVAYVLGFSPQNLTPNGAFHRLNVKLARAGAFVIETRKGYFAPTKKEQAERNAPDFDAVVTGTQSLAEMPLEIATRTETLESGAAVLKIVARVDVRGLPFQRRDGRNIEQLRLVTALFDKDGKFLHGRQSLMELSLKESTLARLTSEGLEMHLTVQAPAGSYTLRQVVQEAVEGKIAAVSRRVEIQ